MFYKIWMRLCLRTFQRKFRIKQEKILFEKNWFIAKKNASLKIRAQGIQTVYWWRNKRDFSAFVHRGCVKTTSLSSKVLIVFESDYPMVCVHFKNLSRERVLKFHMCLNFDKQNQGDSARNCFKDGLADKRIIGSN